MDGSELSDEGSYNHINKIDVVKRVSVFVTGRQTGAQTGESQSIKQTEASSKTDDDGVGNVRIRFGHSETASLKPDHRNVASDRPRDLNINH